MRALIVAGCLFAALPAHAEKLQVAIAVEPGIAELRPELEAIEETLLALKPDVELALYYCGAQPQKFGARGLADSVAKLKEDRACSFNTDVVRRAIEELNWEDGASKRVLAIGYEVFETGRGTGEELAHFAELRGIVLHAFELSHHLPIYWDRIFAASREVRLFLDKPEDLPRQARDARQIVLLSGGKYHVFFFGKRYTKLERHPNFPAELERAFAPGKTDRDGLDDLAEGKRRVREVELKELPIALHRVSLEPLLDAIFDFVDARRVLLDVAQQYAANDPTPGRVGVLAAKALLEPRRIKPSRR